MNAQMDESYQGYSNRETWAVCLWLDNDEGMYQETRNKSAKRLKEEIEYILEEFKEQEWCKSMREDIGSLWRVDWHEVEENCKDE